MINRISLRTSCRRYKEEKEEEADDSDENNDVSKYDLSDFTLVDETKGKARAVHRKFVEIAICNLIKRKPTIVHAQNRIQRGRKAKRKRTRSISAAEKGLAVGEGRERRGD